MAYSTKVERLFFTFLVFIKHWENTLDFLNIVKIICLVGK